MAFLAYDVHRVIATDRPINPADLANLNDAMQQRHRTDAESKFAAMIGSPSSRDH